MVKQNRVIQFIFSYNGNLNDYYTIFVQAMRAMNHISQFKSIFDLLGSCAITAKKSILLAKQLNFITL